MSRDGDLGICTYRRYIPYTRYNVYIVLVVKMNERWIETKEKMRLMSEQYAEMQIALEKAVAEDLELKKKIERIQGIVGCVCEY